MSNCGFNPDNAARTVDLRLSHTLATLGPLPPRGTSEPKCVNIGWTLGNWCPYKCRQCYSRMVRQATPSLTKAHVDRIIGQLVSIGVKTVNLGGNEPLFTSGRNPADTLLPYIIRSLHDAGIIVGITTAGITMTYMDRHFPEETQMLNDCDISIDSPFADEHNENRGSKLFKMALRAADICTQRNMDHTFIVCGMNWNLTRRHLEALADLSIAHNAFMRINFMKPTEPGHMELVPSVEQFYETTQWIFENCDVIELGEPLGSACSGQSSRGCPCGSASFRIHSITEDGRVPVSPCVYAHAFKGQYDLLTDDLEYITRSPEFEAYRQRRQAPETIEECGGCAVIEQCRGGCASRAYLWREMSGGQGHFRNIRDPYCLRDFGEAGQTVAPNLVGQDRVLVHNDYLCTVIFKPRPPA